MNLSVHEPQVDETGAVSTPVALTPILYSARVPLY